MSVTRSLNIRCLWIDVICIIQDSVDDDWSKKPLTSESTTKFNSDDIRYERRQFEEKDTPEAVASLRATELHLKSERLAREGGGIRPREPPEDAGLLAEESGLAPGH